MCLLYITLLKLIIYSDQLHITAVLLMEDSFQFCLYYYWHELFSCTQVSGTGGYAHQSSKLSRNVCFRPTLMAVLCFHLFVECPTHTISCVEKAFESEVHAVVRLYAQCVMQSSCLVVHKVSRSLILIMDNNSTLFSFTAWVMFAWSQVIHETIDIFKSTNFI